MVANADGGEKPENGAHIASLRPLKPQKSENNDVEIFLCTAFFVLTETSLLRFAMPQYVEPLG